MTAITPNTSKDNTLNPHCQFYVLKKKRLCRMTVKHGEKYCGEHIDHQLNISGVKDLGGVGKKLRIACPYDGTHTCFKTHLAKHMSRCNSKPGSLPQYIVPGLNVGTCEQEPVKVSLLDLSDEELTSIINKINQVYHECQGATRIGEHLKQHPVLSGELRRPDLGAPALKHLVQNSALLALMRDSGLLQEHTCYLEMGAGKGKLTYWLAQAVKDVEDSTFALVDRASYRHKNENKLKTPDNEITRIRADIADLCLRKVGCLQRSQHVVAVSKHLCGAATDLALRCVGSSMQREPAGAGWNMHGLVMALCCHHRCDWKNYVGKHFFNEVGLSGADFTAMCVLASWATCGSGRSRGSADGAPPRREGPPSEQPAVQQAEENKHRDRYVRLKLTQEVREEVGRKCKHLIDFGRDKYLESIGFTSKLLFYVNQNTTLENVCVVATAK